jgi:hypothetical protein
MTLFDSGQGLGSPVFDKLEAELAKAAMSLPATKGFEIGSGFAGILHLALPASSVSCVYNSVTELTSVMFCVSDLMSTYQINFVITLFNFGHLWQLISL